MLDALEALHALHAHGTMGRAGAALRVSQSAVSKRLATLEARTGRPLLARRGRRVVLTPAGERLVARTAPLLAELRAALGDAADAGRRRLVLGCSESVLASYGALALRRTGEVIPGLEVEVHAHRSPVVVERVRGGEVLLGLCAGVGSPPAGLDLVHVLEEPLVLVPAGLAPFRWPRGDVEVLTIESHAATFQAVRARLGRHGLRVKGRVESFACAVQMARAGLGHALVPRGIAAAMGVPPEARRHVRRGGLARPVVLVGRAATLARPWLAEVVEVLAELAAEEEETLGSAT